MVNSIISDRDCHITEETKPQAVPELFIDVRKDEFLILNPSGPRWFVGSKLHADFLKLCDGKRSVRDIFELLSPGYQNIKITDVILFVNSLFQLQFFTETGKQPIQPCGIAHFYVTERCNLKCPFCFFDSTPTTSKKKNKELEPAVWINLADEIAAINPHASISISGGEPLIRNDTIDIIEGISRFNLSIRLITNGTLVTEDLIRRLAEIPQLNVQVSIDSILPEENARTRGQGNLEKAIKAVLSMIDSGIKLGITATVTQINKNSTWRLKKFCKQHNISFGTSFFFMSGNRSRNNAGWLELKPEEIIESSINNSNYFKDDEIEKNSLIPGKLRYHCGIGLGQIAIHPEGSVSPCRLLLDPQFYLGNVMKSELPDILKIAREKYDFMDVDKVKCGCAKCPVRYFCAGGCKATSYYNYGMLDQYPPNCSILKKIYIESLWTSVLGPTEYGLERLLDDSMGIPE